MNTKATPTVIGIDIGASTTKIAAVQRGAIDIITNEANFRETPSIVGYGEGERKIGEAGNVKIKSNLKNTIISPMRYLGLQNGSENSQKQVSFCPCASLFDGEELKFKINYNGKQQNLTPEQVLASYFTELSKIVQFNNLDEKLIMVAVPSYFTQKERKSVLAAAQIANLKNIELVNESAAMGLDYGAFKKNEMGEGKNVLFVDFGHSKLSASLIKFTNSDMEILNQRSNRNIGCRNIDMKVFQQFANNFKNKTGLDLNENKKACLKLLETIQRQRKILSGINETEVSIECLMEDEDICENFSRDLMKEVAQEVFEQIKNLLQSMKEQLAEQNIHIDMIELVGGGSRIPEVIKIISQVFQIKPSRTINSNEAIARGATLAAVQKSGLFRFHSYKIINKNSLPIKISWKIQKDQSEMQAEEGFPALQNSTLFDLNEKVPMEKEFKLTGQGKVQILVSYDILQEQVQKKILNINFEVAEQTEFNAVFEVDENKFVSLKKLYNEKNKEKINFSMEEFGTVSRKEIADYAIKEREMFVRDFQIVQGYEKKNLLESLIYSEKDKIQRNNDLQKYVPGEDLNTAIARMDAIVMEISEEGQNLKIKDYEQKTVEVQKILKDLETIAQQKQKQQSLVEGYYGELEKLQQRASENMQFIVNNFRNSRRISQIYEQIKGIHDWAEEVIRVSKSKPVNELPLVPQKDINTQKSNLDILMGEIKGTREQNPRFMPQAQTTPRRRQYTDHDPFGMSRNSGFFGGFPRNDFFGRSGFF